MTTLGVERGNAVDLHGIADSPQAVRGQKPKWTQFRFVAGVLLVVGSVLIGAKIIAGADQSSVALVANRPLAVGMTVTNADVTRVRVRLYDNPTLYLTGAIPPGYVVLRPIGQGEFVPQAAVGAPANLVATGAEPRRWVTVPVAGGHYPPGIGSGDTVDVYTTTKTGAGVQGGTSLLIASVLVDRGLGSSSGGLGGGSSGASVVLIIPESRVVDIITALQRDSLDLVLIAKAQAR
ncbi:MAG: hypothetical protein QOC60_1295 [Frankiaceae bacterium]|nr:hypothetical protein [Frankiaceae bacterium]